MTAVRRPPCSDQSIARGDPMYGTASAGTRWLLLEIDGPWGHSAFFSSPTMLEPALGRAIVRRAEAAGMRIAAIRRHGRRAPTRRWRWYVAHAEPGAETLLHGEVDGVTDYLDVPLDGAGGEPVAGPLVAVCAHGKHDQCCAVRGRSAVAAIAAAYPENTWECSHLGGDRFAATMLILPEGLCYGRVDSTDGAELVRLYQARRLAPDHLRGRTSLPHAVQAAQHFARQTLGDDRIDTLAPVSVDRSDPAGPDHPGHVVHVVLDHETGPLAVTIGEQMSEPLLSQCSATVEGRVRTYRLLDLRRG